MIGTGDFRWGDILTLITIEKVLFKLHIDLPLYLIIKLNDSKENSLWPSQ